MKNEMNMGEAPACFSFYEQAGQVTLLDERRYCFLFVLQGSIQCYASCRTERFGSRTLVIIDKQQIDRCICSLGTALLEFLPPRRIDHFFQSTAAAFGTPTSECVPFNEDIDNWIEELRCDCLHGVRPDEYAYCCHLRKLLRQYPDIVLGTLVIPLHACALTSKKCVQCRAKCEDAHEIIL